MPHVEITIGGRNFEVACQEGEEHFLHTAAAMLDVEAAHLASQVGRITEARMLLMAGLMLADKTAGLEEKVKETDGKMAQLQARIDMLESRPADRVEVPVIPAAVTETLAELAARAEAMADQVESRAEA
ncbi:cell division protein ZapA [bacterium]|nr:cell division protein ZapA [bacterium]